MMPRPQFTLRALLVLMLAVGCFFGGMAVQRQLDQPELISRTRGLKLFKMKGLKIKESQPTLHETIRLRDGSKWERVIDEKPPTD